MLANVLDVAARAVVVRDRDEWVALASDHGVAVELGRSPLAAPLVKGLKEKGYSVRFSFSWHRAVGLDAANSAVTGRRAGVAG